MNTHCDGANVGGAKRAAQAMTQLPLDPPPPSSFMGGSEVSSLHTTQLPLEPPPPSSLTGGRTMSSCLVGMVGVNESMDVRMWVDKEKWASAWSGSLACGVLESVLLFIPEGRLYCAH